MRYTTVMVIRTPLTLPYFSNLFGCNAVQSGRLCSIGQHGITSRKIIFFIATAVITSNSTVVLLFSVFCNTNESKFVLPRNYGIRWVHIGVEYFFSIYRIDLTSLIISELSRMLCSEEMEPWRIIVNITICSVQRSRHGSVSIMTTLRAGGPDFEPR
jgi:hypothetical protein